MTDFLFSPLQVRHCKQFTGNRELSCCSEKLRKYNGYKVSCKVIYFNTNVSDQVYFGSWELLSFGIYAFLLH